VPGPEIVQFALSHAADLIVLAWHGRFDHQHAATLRAVLGASPCPVLVLRV
jgi:nucleotide-binding universal stress UspA family protein